MNFVERLVEMSFGKAFVVGIILAGVYYTIGYDNGDKQIQLAQQSRAKTQNFQREFEEVQKNLNRSREFKETLKIKDEQFLTFTSYIPERLNVSDMMRAISSEAKAAGVNILSVKEAQTNEEKYQFTDPIAVEVSLEGGFPQHILFMSYLTRLDSIFTVDQMSFASNTNKQTDPNDISVMFTARIIGYRYVSAAKEAPANGVPAGGKK